MSFVCVLLFAMSSYAFHIMSSCASHFAYMFVSCIRAFSPLSVLQSGTPTSSGTPFCLFSFAGVKHSRNGPRFAKWPWYTTGRPPVKFRAIWSLFDTPTVNRVTVKASFVCSPTPLQSGPITHQNLSHVLRRRITIAWSKTTPHLDTPTSF